MIVIPLFEVWLCWIICFSYLTFWTAAAKSLQSRPPTLVRPQRWQPTRLCRPWDSPGKNTGVGCHFLLQCMKVKCEREVAQSCPTLSDPMDCSPPDFSIHGIFQARVLEWGAIEQLGLLNFWVWFSDLPPQFGLLSSYLYFVMFPFDHITSSLPSWNFKHGSLKRSPFLKGFYFF